MEYLEHKAAWIGAPLSICGRRMRQARLGHYRVLEMAESPFVAGGRASVGDLALAYAVLRERWRLGVAIAGSPSLASVLGRRVFLWAGDSRRDILAEFSKLRDWLDCALFVPGEFRGEDKRLPDPTDGMVACPSAMLLAVRLAPLVGALRRPVRCVWDAPLAEAVSVIVADGAAKGARYIPRGFDDLDDLATVGHDIDTGGERL